MLPAGSTVDRSTNSHAHAAASVNVIVGFDGKPVSGTDQLLSLLDGSAIGRDAELLVLRRSKELRLNVRPQEQPAG